MEGERYTARWREDLVTRHLGALVREVVEEGRKVWPPSCRAWETYATYDGGTVRCRHWYVGSGRRDSEGGEWIDHWYPDPMSAAWALIANIQCAQFELGNSSDGIVWRREPEFNQHRLTGQWCATARLAGVPASAISVQNECE